MITFNGPAAVQTYRAIAIRSALVLWRDHKIKANSAYTPSAMMRVAAEITGKAFKPRDYDAAISALTSWLEAR